MNYVKLNNGKDIPVFGYGVYCIPKDECEKCVLEALKVGYRHIDAAQIYKNEEEVGNAISKCGIPREELFITNKIWVCNYGYKKAKESIDRSLKRLKTDYIDLMLIHRPYANYKGAWKALEEGVKEGKIRSIGLSNFNVKETESILAMATIKPVVNQIECHPYGQQKEMRAYLKEKDIAVEAWFPIGHGDKQLLTDPVLSEIAQKYGKTVAQVILRWHVQVENITFPKSVKPERIKENFDIFDFELSQDDMAKIEALDKGKYCPTPPKWLDTIISKFKRA